MITSSPTMSKEAGSAAALRLLRLLLTVAGLFLFYGTSVASSATHAFTFEQTEVVRRIIRDYLTRNPEVIVEAIDAWRTRDQAKTEARTQQVLAARQAELLDDPGSPVTGNPRGNVTIVEFFDYRCSYCKMVHPTIQALLREDGNLRFVYKEWPILGQLSSFAARAALAARSQGKYVEFHGALMDVRGGLDEVAVYRVAVSVGLNVERLKRDMEGQAAEIQAILARNDNLARSLDIAGTPAFVVGDVVIRGATDMKTMKKVVADVRRRPPR